MAADALAPYVSHDIDYVEYVGPGVTWERILSTCVISKWSNDMKCKCMFMFPLQNLVRDSITIKIVRSGQHNRCLQDNMFSSIFMIEIIICIQI